MNFIKLVSYWDAFLVNSLSNANIVVGKVSAWEVYE